MKTITAHDIHYSVSTHRDLASFEGSKLVDTVVGNIYVYSDDDKQVSIGSFEATIVKLSKLCDSGEHPLDSLDQTQSIADVANAILDGEEPKESLKEMFDPCLSGDFVIIEQIELEPEWRGANIGLAVIRDFIYSHIDIDTLVIVEPAPLSKNVKNKTKAEIDRQSAKLAKHWKKLGFKKIPNSDYFAFCTNYKLKNIEVGA